MMHKGTLRNVLVALIVVSLLGSALTMSVAADEGLVHTVKWGQTLGWIAWRYGVDLSELMEVNDLDNANYIYVGQELTIPGDFPDSFEHEVQAGETLLEIAAEYGVSIWDIAKINGMWNTNLVFPGDILMIPGEPLEDADDGATEDAAAEEDEDVVAEAIVISSPALNDEVSSPVTVTGLGSAFENNLAVDILDENGLVIGQGFATIDADLGEMGPFSGTIEFTPPATAQMGRISVYSVSARDGAIEHLNSVSVMLQP